MPKKNNLFSFSKNSAEKYENKYEAAKRERQLKGWSHAKKQMLVDGRLGLNVCTEIVEEMLQKNLNP